MTISVLFITLVVVFFILLTVAIVGLARAYDEDMLGGLIVMWSAVAILLLATFLVGGNSKITEPAKADQTDVR